MKRFSAPPTTAYQDPSRPPNDDESDASLSDGSKKVKTAQSFESLFNSESLSDIVLDINGGQYVFHAHKMIVGLKSERLAALITSVVSPLLDNNSSRGGSDISPFSTSTDTSPNNNSVNSVQNNNILNNNNMNSTTGGKPVLFLHESPECAAVFSRFLYFIYSGSVWLHRDYVLPLFQLSLKYGMAALASHCENYVLQLLQKTLNSTQTSTSSLPCLSVRVVCDLCEEQGYREETRRAAFSLLARRFAELACTERWAECRWATVRDLLLSNECSCDENLILVAATDWMKRNKLQDRSQIQEILAAIRYPRLPRRVLYHLHTTATFKNFPQVQELIAAAIRYHCFKDVPEAQGDFSGLQYHPRGGTHSHAAQGGHGSQQTSAPGLMADLAGNPQPTSYCVDSGAQADTDMSVSQTRSSVMTDSWDQSKMSECDAEDDDSSPDLTSSHNIMFREEPPPPPNAPLPRTCRALHHNNNHNHLHHHHHHHNHIRKNRTVHSSSIPDSPLSTFQAMSSSTGSPVAAVPPRVQNTCRSSSSRDSVREHRSDSPNVLQQNPTSHTRV